MIRLIRDRDPMTITGALREQLARPNPDRERVEELLTELEQSLIRKQLQDSLALLVHQRTRT